MNRDDRKALLDQVSAILVQHDPAGVYFGSNVDEYIPEAIVILDRIPCAMSVEDACRIIQEEFARFFPRVPLRCDFDKLTLEIWKLWQEQGAPSCLVRFVD